MQRKTMKNDQEDEIMKKTQNCNACQFILEEETVSFGGMLLKYQFLACNNYDLRFHVRVDSGKEHVEATLGNRLDPALKLYRAIVRGRVTPCGLHDVVSDRCV